MTKETNRFTRYEPCPRPNCGFKYGFHICLDPEQYDMGTAAPEKKVKPNFKLKTAFEVGNTYAARERTPEERSNMSLSAHERWNKVRETNKERDRKIANDYEKEWLSILEISLKYGIGKDTVKRVLEEESVTIRPRGVTKKSVYFKENALEISLEYTEHNKSLEEIATKYGVSHTTVKRTFKAIGVKTRSGPRPKYAFN